MLIAIDISQIIYDTGVSKYTKQLVRNLLEIDKKNKYLLFGGSLRRLGELKSFTKTLKGNFSTKFFLIPPTMANILWNNFRFPPIERLIGKVDVFHSSDWTQPPSKAYKVTTIHDLSFIKFPKSTNRKIYDTHKKRLKLVKEKVDSVISPSIATRDDLVAFGIERKKIAVIPEGPFFKKVDKEKVAKVKSKYKIHDKYLLAVGVRPRKNTNRIIEAFHLAAAGEGIKLVIVGHPTGIKTKDDRGLRFTGYINDDDLQALYTGAEALVYPSLYEGFGIPILDAFNCETPVVTSNISSMPEVAGNAAVLVDPESTDSIVQGIKEALSKKKTLVKKGLIQVNKFTWRKTAEETLKVYEKLNQIEIL